MLSRVKLVSLKTNVDMNVKAYYQKKALSFPFGTVTEKTNKET